MKKIILLIVISAGFFLAARFLLGGDEDTWICRNGEWVEHGHPSAPKPQSVCR